MLLSCVCRAHLSPSKLIKPEQLCSLLGGVLHACALSNALFAAACACRAPLSPSELLLIHSFNHAAACVCRAPLSPLELIKHLAAVQPDGWCVACMCLSNVLSAAACVCRAPFSPSELIKPEQLPHIVGGVEVWRCGGVEAYEVTLAPSLNFRKCDHTTRGSFIYCCCHASAGHPCPPLS
jgi:hypothetical protein